MLKELNDEQIAKLPEYAQKWIDIGMNTDTIDVEKSLEAMRKAYEQVDLEFPEKYEVYDSPFEAIAKMKENYDVDVSPQDFIFGSHESFWLSFYDYLFQETEVENSGKLDAFMDLAKHCGWVLAFDEMVVLTHKPISIKMDAENRTHCEDDLAIKFKDGTGVAVWHGQRIPQEWILDKSSLDPQKILYWENVEQRRAGCEILGWDKILDTLDHKVLDKDGDPTVGTLLEVDLPDSGLERFLLAIDPNVGKQICLPVPNDVNTALEANSWTYGIKQDIFKPDFRV